MTRQLILSFAALAFAPLLPGETIQSQTVDWANTVGRFNFGQSVTTPAGRPWNNLRFNFVIGESGQLFGPQGTGAFGTLFLLSQAYAGTAAGLDAATPGFLATPQDRQRNLALRARRDAPARHAVFLLHGEFPGRHAGALAEHRQPLCRGPRL